MAFHKAKTPAALVFFAFFFLVAEAFASDGLDVEYNVKANFKNIHRRMFRVHMQATITNRSDVVLKEIQWVLYPNRFLKELPGLNDINYFRVYPTGPSYGGMSIVSVQEDGIDASSRFEAISVPPLPEQTLYSMELAVPLEPNQTRQISFTYDLNVPKKLGSFGYYRGRLTLSGGWTPYVVSFREGQFHPTDQSPQANWKVSITADTPWIAGETVQTAGENIQVEKKSGQFPIQFSKRLFAHRFEKFGYSLTVVHNEKNFKKMIRVFDNVFEPWVEHMRELKLPPDHSKDLVFVQAPLREMLTVNAGDVTFFSDRAYKTIKPLRTFHNVPIIRMLFSQSLFPFVAKKESSKDYYWVSEALSNQLTEDYLQTQRYKHRDAREIGLIKAFSILPTIDQIIHTPQFAFYDVFYNLVYPVDPVRDEFSKFSNRRQYGGSVRAHMIDELGEDQLRKIVFDYLESDQRFTKAAEAVVHQDLSQRFEHWTLARPAINYSIKKISSAKTPQGFSHKITVEKISKIPVEEPVEIVATEKDGTKNKVIWNQPESQHTVELETDQKLKSVEVDPRKRLLEYDLSDNRSPPYWKMVLTELYLQYDFNANNPIGILDAQIRRRYGGKDRYNFGGFYEADSYGIHLGYVRLFGSILDSLRLSNGAGIRFNFSRLSEDLVTVGEPAVALVRVTPSGYLTSLTASYFFGNRVSYTNPLSGVFGAVAFTYGSKAFGGDYDFYRTSLTGSWIWKLHPSHLLAFRGLFGVSGPEDIPTQAQFRLGGILNMRGLAFGEERFIGRNILLFSGEYRHFLFQDIDVNLGLFRIRDIQGVVFTDAGRVTNTVQEEADKTVLGSIAASTRFTDVFNFSKFETDAGYSIHFLIDYLGVSPSLLRFDVAQSISDYDQGLRFYFGATQSF